ncbi:MAG: alpha/beta hydrolase [Pseudomonadota bacterium]
MATDGRVSKTYKLIASAQEDAPWLVLVHGLSQDHRVFDKQVESFSPCYRICLIDLPGHGMAEHLDGPYGLPEYAAHIQAVLTDAEIVKPHFWGTHLGAGAGVLLACPQPDLFQSLILEGPVFPGRSLPAVGSVLDKVGRVAQGEGIEKARAVWWDEGEWFDVMRAHPKACRAQEQRAIIDDFKGRPWLDAGLASKPLPPIDGQLVGIQPPVLIYNGQHDLQDFVDAADALVELLPNCRREVLPEAGGFPLWEFPDRVNTLVHAFLQGRRLD